MTGAVDDSIPLLRLPELRRPPVYADLIQILKNCERNKDRYIVQPWLTGTHNLPFSLRAFLSGSGQEYLRLKNEGKLIQPEWTLFSGPEHSELMIWTYSTRDLELVLSLIISELESSNRAQAHPLINATLRDMPSRSVMEQKLAEQAKDKQPDLAFRQGAGSAPNAVSTAERPLLAIYSLIQSVFQNRQSGAMVLANGAQTAVVIFQDGEAVDATVNDTAPSASASASASVSVDSALRGESAFFEVVTWKGGSASFDDSRRHYTASLSRKTAVLLSEGRMLCDCWDALVQRGITMDTHFAQLRSELSLKQFQTIIQHGLPITNDGQIGVYAELKSDLSLQELLKRKPMPKSVWVPVIYNLLTLQLIAILPKHSTPAKREILEFSQQDSSQFAQQLVSAETHICSQSALSYFVNREVLRFKRTGRLFAVLLFSARARRGAQAEALSSDALKECVERIRSVLGPLDILGHYQSADFAMLLPESGHLSEPGALFDAYAACLSQPPLPGIETVKQLELTISLYEPERSGRLLLVKAMSYVGAQATG